MILAHSCCFAWASGSFSVNYFSNLYNISFNLFDFCVPFLCMIWTSFFSSSRLFIFYLSLFISVVCMDMSCIAPTSLPASSLGWAAVVDDSVADVVVDVVGSVVATGIVVATEDAI